MLISGKTETGAGQVVAGAEAVAENDSGVGAVSAGRKDTGAAALERVDGRKENGNAATGSDDFCPDCAVGLISIMGAGAIGGSALPVLEDTGGDASESIDGRKEKGSAAIGSDNF